MARTSLTLQKILQQSSLGSYYDNFVACGIEDPASLLTLTMQDYPTFGITSMHDREKLFSLIQTIKGVDGMDGRTSRLPQTPTTASKSAVKRPRVSTGNSPSLPGKVKSKSQLIEARHGADDKITLTPIRNQSSTLTAGYNYGVPSTKSKTKLLLGKHNLASPGQSALDSRIRVCVRKRPLSREEQENGEQDITDVSSRDAITIRAMKVAVDLQKYLQQYQFVFEEVFDERFTNREVYERTAKPLVNAIFSRGVKATCFAYGCTGSGKTYTMLGTPDIPGLYLLAASDIFTILHSSKHGQGLGMWVSFYEIYCGQLFDLLNGREKLFARENAMHQVCITGLTEKRVGNVEQLMEVIESGGNVRSTGATGVNADSSRSHAILQLELKVDTTGDSIGRFSFIDLAGSERAVDVTDTDKQTRMEGAEINQSLLALKECIRSLDQESRHTPFRQSKLTQVLKDSFVGNTMTCMIANISPNLSSCENTLNTLRYADRVKELKKDSGPPSSPTRPVTVHGTDSKLWPQTGDHLPPPNDLARSTSQDLKLQISKSNSTDHLHKALKRLKMDEAELSGGNIRPHTMATPSRVMSRNTKKSGNREIKLSAVPGTYTESSKETSEEMSTSESATKLQTLNKGKSKLAAERNTSNVLKIEQSEDKEEDKAAKEVSRQVLGSRGGRGFSKQPMAGKPCTAEPRSRSRFAASNSDSSGNKTDYKEVLEEKEASLPNTRAAEKRFVPRRTNEKGKQSWSSSSSSLTASRFASRQSQNVPQVTERLPKDEPQVSRFASREEESIPQGAKVFSKGATARTSRFAPRRQKVPEGEEKPPREEAARVSEQIKTEVPVVRSSGFSCTRSSEVEYRVGEVQDRVEGVHCMEEGVQGKVVQFQGAESREAGDQEESPPMNNRYSRRIKARLSKLFNGKPVEDNNMQSVEQTPVRHLDSISTSQSSPRALTQEQVVAAHHTHLAMITGLCHEEMVLLKHIDKGEQDFTEYVIQLEDILIQKRACIDSLQEKLSRWKSRKS